MLQMLHWQAVHELDFLEPASVLKNGLKCEPIFKMQVILHLNTYKILTSLVNGYA